jgi:hypothetical protein
MTIPSQSSIQTRRWAFGWSITILLLSCVPYLIALYLAPDGWHFAGFLTNPLDGHSYLAKMQQGAAGQWLFHLTYSPEPDEGAFIFIFYLALGHLARLTHLPLIVMFHLARLVAGFLLLTTAFQFICRVTPQPFEQRLAFGLLISASGLGWLGAMLGAFPIDLWVPEAFVPYSLYTNPHFPLAMALMLLIFQQIIWPPQGMIKDKGRLPTTQALGPLAKTGLVGLVLALILPFALLTTLAVLAVYMAQSYLWQRRLPWLQIWPTLSLAFFASPVVVYDLWVSTTQPMLAAWSAQNITAAPPLSDVIWGYGLVGLLAIGGGWFVLRAAWYLEQPGERLILIWAGTTLLLLYAPLDLQRRLINGLHIPLCLLAAIGLNRALKDCPHWRHLCTVGLVTLGAVGTLFVWGLPLLSLGQAPTFSGISARLFVRAEEQAVFNWLRENSTPEAVILAGPRLGMFIPGQTGNRVWYGHPFETVRADQKEAALLAFYRGQSDPPALVDFIIYGSDEQALGQPKNLDTYPVVFSTKTITLYEVKN